VLKQTVVIIEVYHFGQLYTKFYPASCCQGELHMQRKSSLEISTQQVNYWSCILHWSYIWEKMGIHFCSVSAIYRLHEILRFRYESCLA